MLAESFSVNLGDGASGTASTQGYIGEDKAREQALAGLFETPETALQALQETYSIDYVYIGPYERANYDCDIDYFNAHASIVFDNGSVVIYELSPTP